MIKKTQNELKFRMQEIVSIFKREAQEITGNREEARQYARIAIEDFKDHYERKIR